MLQISSNSFSMFKQSVPIAAKSQPVQQKGTKVLLRTQNHTVWTRLQIKIDQDGPGQSTAKVVMFANGVGSFLSPATAPLILFLSPLHTADINPKKDFLNVCLQTWFALVFVLWNSGSWFGAWNGSATRPFLKRDTDVRAPAALLYTLLHICDE